MTENEKDIRKENRRKLLELNRQGDISESIFHLFSLYWHSFLFTLYLKNIRPQHKKLCM